MVYSNPQPAVNSFEVSPFCPAFYMACNWACVIALLKLASQLFTTSPQSLHNHCCTSPQYLLLHLTTIFAAPHHKSTAPHHNLCCTSPQIHWTSPRSLLHLTTIFAAPHHRSTLTTICAAPHHRSIGTSPQTSLQPQTLTWLIETLHLAL